MAGRPLRRMRLRNPNPFADNPYALYEDAPRFREATATFNRIITKAEKAVEKATTELDAAIYKYEDVGSGDGEAYNAIYNAFIRRTKVRK